VDGDLIADLKIAGQGCSISQSSASMMSAAVKGKTVAQARSTIRAFRAMMSLHVQQLDGPGSDEGDKTGPERSGAEVAADEGVALGDLEALQGVVKFPVRIKCATLSWHTLAQALDEAEAPAPATGS
jgi:nitrogen fixation NifU-like protein